MKLVLAAILGVVHFAVAHLCFPTQSSSASTTSPLNEYPSDVTVDATETITGLATDFLVDNLILSFEIIDLTFVSTVTITVHIVCEALQALGSTWPFSYLVSRYTLFHTATLGLRSSVWPRYLGSQPTNRTRADSLDRPMCVSSPVFC